MTLFNISLEERTGRVETQLLELEDRRRIRKEFFPYHLEIIEATARASVHATLPLMENDSSDEFEYESHPSNEHEEQDPSLPSPVDLPEQQAIYVDTVFDIFDRNRDGFWCMTEANRWMRLMENQMCNLEDWEYTCQSAQCDPAKGLDLEAVRQWYRTANCAERHFEAVVDESGEPDFSVGKLTDSDLHRLDTMLEHIFNEFDVREEGVWDEEAGSTWLEYLGWYDTWQEACECAGADGLTLSKEHVAVLYGANEYLLARHTVGRWKEKNEGNTFNADDDEDEEEYCVGGYHRVEVGDVYNDKYKILRKLGWGNFSTVWLASDTSGGVPVALKIGKGASAFREMSELEVDVLKKANAHFDEAEAGILKECAKKLVRLTDFFNIQGPHGTHPTMALEAVGPDILKLLTAHDFAGVAPCIVKMLIKDMLQGIAFLHDMGLAHADIKPENVLIQTISPDGTTDAERTAKLLAGTLERPEGMSLAEFVRANYACKVSDFGSSKWVHVDKTVHQMQTLEYRAPEVVLGYSPGVAIDIWSVACTCFELLSGCFLFNPKACQGPLTQEASHISLFMRTLGPFPQNLVLGGGRHCDNFFNQDGSFRYGPVETQGIHDAMNEKFVEGRTDLLEDFLAGMLSIDTEERTTALQAIEHEWLNVVEGDDVILVRDRHDDDDEDDSLQEHDHEHNSSVQYAQDDDHHHHHHQSQPVLQGDSTHNSYNAGEEPSPAYEERDVHASDAHDAEGPSRARDMSSVVVEGKALVMLTLRHRADYADLRRDELVERRKLRTAFFPKHLQAIKESARARA